MFFAISGPDMAKNSGKRPFGAGKCEKHEENDPSGPESTSQFSASRAPGRQDKKNSVFERRIYREIAVEKSRQDFLKKWSWSHGSIGAVK